MGRRAKRAKVEAESARPRARKSPEADARTVQELETDLAEALEQRAALSEILQVIRRSRTDVQPVLETIVANVARLCGAADVAFALVDGNVHRVIAWVGPFFQEWRPDERSLPTTRGAIAGRAILDRRTVHVHDLAAVPEDEYPVGRALQQRFGHHTMLAVPLLLDDVPLGVIAAVRTQVRPFTERQIDLVRTFADQAVIAIENVRLFTELQASNSNLREALDKQTATSEILRAISSSPTDEQSVFDAIVRSAARLCRAAIAAVFRTDGTTLYHPANYGGSPDALATIRAQYPRPLDMATTPGIAILTRSTIDVPDVEDPSATDSVRHTARVIGFRSVVAVPMLREGNAVGAIVVGRREPGRFPETEVELLKTFADQAVIAIENVRLFTELQEKNQALTTAHAQVTEALEQQTATSEILQVISSSPTDVQPVFDAIAVNALRLCDAQGAVVVRYDGALLHVAAHHNVNSEAVDRLERQYPLAPDRHNPMGEAVLDGAVVHVPDLQAAVEYSGSVARQFGARSHVSIPLLHQGRAVGAIGISRRRLGPFSDRQIELLKSFADQAVIALENVRLFKELQARNRDLTATGDVLRAISTSPTDVQPVFDTILANALRLCEAHNGGVFTFDGQGFRIAAAAEVSDEFLAFMQEGVILPGRETPLRRVGLDLRVSHVADIFADPSFSPPEAYRREGMRTLLAVPMVKDGRLVGALAFHRRVVQPFTDQQIALLQTFADQAVIAIENVRLFNETKEALEQQTATAEILKVISSSPTDAQPVFETILENATRLCEARRGSLFLFDGEAYHAVAFWGAAPALVEHHMRAPIRPGPHTALGRLIYELRPVHIDDVLADAAFREGDPLRRAVVELEGMRTLLMVPLLKEGRLVGSIGIHRGEVHPFSARQISLVQTFADQAVIAIENVRLFTELQARSAELTQSVDELTALGEVSRALSSTLDLETVLQTIVSRAVQIAGTAGCTIWEYDQPRAEFRLRASHYADQADAALLHAPGRVMTLPKGQGVTTRVMEQRQPVQIHDITTARDYESPIRRPLVEAGHRALLGVPLLSEDEVIGVLVVTRKTPGEFEPELVRLLSTFATQSALAIQNARLFLEIEDKSRQLEVASRHKSEFLANMSHELRTPLNAIIGFSEVLAEGMFGEINDKQAEYLRDILESGRHLLSLINDILDLSKIEAGRMELEPTDFDLPAAIDNALTLVRERAGRRGITLGREIDDRVGMIRGDERKVKQVLLNLLSNALKFTSEGGRIDVRATVSDGLVEVSVADTGVGIAPEDQEAVFEEFRQVGTADKKVEGTGLGLALSRKFIELHGGRIWVKSQVGTGSTFTFTIPVRREPSDRRGAPTLIS